jgi:hypothetical protein
MQQNEFAVQQIGIGSAWRNLPRRIAVKWTLSIATVISLAGGTVAFAAGVPTYERTGFPISPVQMQLLGPAHVQERSPAVAVAASPHQANVLKARPGLTTGTTAPARTETGLAAR